MTGVELSLRTGVDLFAGMGGFSEGATAAGVEAYLEGREAPAGAE